MNEAIRVSFQSADTKYWYRTEKTRDILVKETCRWHGCHAQTLSLSDSHSVVIAILWINEKQSIVDVTPIGDLLK